MIFPTFKVPEDDKTPHVVQHKPSLFFFLFLFFFLLFFDKSPNKLLSKPRRVYVETKAVAYLEQWFADFVISVPITCFPPHVHVSSKDCRP